MPGLFLGETARKEEMQEGAGWFSKEGRYRQVSETGEWHTSMGRGRHLLQGVGAIMDSGWTSFSFLDFILCDVAQPVSLIS